MTAGGAIDGQAARNLLHGDVAGAETRDGWHSANCRGRRIEVYGAGRGITAIINDDARGGRELARFAEQDVALNTLRAAVADRQRLRCKAELAEIKIRDREVEEGPQGQPPRCASDLRRKHRLADHGDAGRGAGRCTGY